MLLNLGSWHSADSRGSPSVRQMERLDSLRVLKENNKRGRAGLLKSQHIAPVSAVNGCALRACVPGGPAKAH